MSEENTGIPKTQSELTFKSSSTCLLLWPDDKNGKIDIVSFSRDEDGNGDIDKAAAALLGLSNGDRVRCHSLPGKFDKKLGLAYHYYFDTQGTEHKLPHNTNATQAWLCAHLPDEPPEVTPSVISGPVLVTADNLSTEEFVDLTLAHWRDIMKLCKEVCPNAVFL